MQSVLYECGPHLGCAQGLDCPYAVTQRVSKTGAWTAAHKQVFTVVTLNLLKMTLSLLLRHNVAGKCPCNDRLQYV